MFNCRADNVRGFDHPSAGQSLWGTRSVFACTSGYWRKRYPVSCSTRSNLCPGFLCLASVLGFTSSLSFVSWYAASVGEQGLPLVCLCARTTASLPSGMGMVVFLRMWYRSTQVMVRFLQQFEGHALGCLNHTPICFMSESSRVASASSLSHSARQEPSWFSSISHPRFLHNSGRGFPFVVTRECSAQKQS